MHANILLKLNDDKSLLTISGQIHGDFFPANETFISDEIGNKIFLGTSGALGGIFTSLVGNRKESMQEFNFSISLNEEGNFTGVVLNGISFSIEEFNSNFIDNNPQEGSGTRVSGTNQ